MAVHYTGGGGGLLGTLGQALSLGASFIPGMQPFAPFIAGATALANGNVGGAMGQMAGAIAGNAFGGGPASNGSLKDALRGAYQDRLPDWHTDPVTGQMGGQRNPWGWR